MGMNHIIKFEINYILEILSVIDKIKRKTLIILQKSRKILTERNLKSATHYLDINLNNLDSFNHLFPHNSKHNSSFYPQKYEKQISEKLMSNDIHQCAKLSRTESKYDILDKLCIKLIKKIIKSFLRYKHFTTSYMPILSTVMSNSKSQIILLRMLILLVTTYEDARLSGDLKIWISLVFLLASLYKSGIAPISLTSSFIFHLNNDT